jgi:hypothetical protein
LHEEPLCHESSRGTVPRDVQAEEDESGALARHLDVLIDDGVELVSSVLLEAEPQRFATLHGLGQAEVSDVLDRFVLFELTRSVFVQAGLSPGRHLRSLDALHIAVAVRVGGGLTGNPTWVTSVTLTARSSL